MTSFLAKHGSKGIFRRWLNFLARNNPEALARALSLQIPELKDRKFAHKAHYEFEDCAPLLTMTPANRGVLRMDFDEAGLLFRLTRELKSPRILEIGRLQGGSVILFALAGDKETHITSVDIEPWNDEALRSVLRDIGAEGRVTLHTCDANSLEAMPEAFDLVFIDGDHRYEGVKKDFEHWRKSLRPNSHLLFHDACNSRRFATGNPDVARLVEEVTCTYPEQLARQPNVGSIAHFTRTSLPWPV